jgi:hypothetical protein
MERHMQHSVFMLLDTVQDKYYAGPYNSWYPIHQAKIWHRPQDAKRARTTAMQEFQLRFDNADINYAKNPQHSHAAQEYFELRTRGSEPDWGLKIMEFELVPRIK